jgi:hypothetical protein
MKIKILKKLKSGLRISQYLEIEDKNGLPTDQFWRARLKDSKSDNCIEIIKDIKIKPKK